MKFGRRYRLTTNAWWYAVWPDPRSRSWALESRKFDHFQTLSPPHLQRGLATDHGFLNYGINYGTIPKAYRGRIFDFLSQFLCHVTLKLAVSSHPQKVSSISRNLVCRQRSTTDAWRYAVWPDPRSRSWALENRKFDNFQTLYPFPFIMGAGKLPRIRRCGSIVAKNYKRCYQH